MATMRLTQECDPKPIQFGNVLLPAGEPDHDACPGGHTIEGVLGGWICPCPCHHPVTSNYVEED